MDTGPPHAKKIISEKYLRASAVGKCFDNSVFVRDATQTHDIKI